ncbi:50S ribosomal protein L29 [Patescibacteria group bacterium]|nr:50S ribosomal protein L29 [Patescibacteria group bacterium]MCL5010563.1 50S ribosomal protein L29 [Patescibacteria group bacterium]
MKTKDKKELRTKTLAELRKLLADKRSELLSLKMEDSLSKLKNKRAVFAARKYIAFVLTCIKEGRQDE